MKKNRLLFFSGLAALLFGGLGLSVEANPSGFFTNCATNTSTSTVSLMTAGTATTTLTCNLGGADQRAVESAVLTIFFNASSTSSVLKGNLEYSNNGIDWFENNLGDLTDVATTSPTASTERPSPPKRRAARPEKKSNLFFFIYYFFKLIIFL